MFATSLKGGCTALGIFTPFAFTLHHRWAKERLLMLPAEKRRLRSNTKLSNLLSQALAASRLGSGEDAAAAGGGDYDSDEELSDHEEDSDLLSPTEDAGGLRGLAANDWARIKILDGHWYSPADQYLGNRVPGKPTVVPAARPCP